MDTPTKKILVAKHSLLSRITIKADDLELINLSFSLAGEDTILRKIFKKQLRKGRPGFYIDLGAADPRIGSNSYLFYCYGWRGLCIDANPRLHYAHREHRPADTFVHAAVGSGGGTIYHAEYKVNQGMSMVRASAMDFNDEFETPTPVPVRRLSEILDAAVPSGTKISFMSVDIEGSELTALQSNDWTRYRPQVIILETQNLDPLRPLEYPTIAYLAQQGYTFCMAICGSVVLKSDDAP